uniref:F-box domain-containing protein n=5 Tax=Triticinae TaxID=1648030 RepID=A0A453J421_AEGTS
VPLPLHSSLHSTQTAARLPNPSLAGMSSPSAAASSPAPALDGGVILEEILEEILLRLPPQPSSLPRASLVCTRWRRILSDPGFLSRFREHHGRNKPPPLLGFFDEEFRRDKRPIFKLTTMGRWDRIPPARFSAPWIRGEGWAFFGCRHGLALLICQKRREAVVWDPLTGHQRRLAFPPGFCRKKGRFVQNAAVMCAAAVEDGHVHGDCRFTPFRLALVGSDSDGTHKFACLYESESGVWGDVVSLETTRSTCVCVAKPSVLVRNSFCWLVSGGGILEFDFEIQSLVVIQKPADVNVAAYHWSFLVVRTQHSGLGLAVFSEPDYQSGTIQLWERKSNRDGVVGWELQKTIQLDGLFSFGLTGEPNAFMMQGYDEDSNAILLSTFYGEYMLQLESMQFINLIEHQSACIFTRTYYPYRNFYVIGKR